MEILLDDFVKVGFVLLIIMVVAIVLVSFFVKENVDFGTFDLWTNHPSDFYFFQFS